MENQCKSKLSEEYEVKQLFVVRLYDGFDNVWIDVTEIVSKEEAEKQWNIRTENGTKNIKFSDIDYYKIFPSNTIMVNYGGKCILE